MPHLIDLLSAKIDQARWPREHRMTMPSRRAYEQGLDSVNAYRGDPQRLLDALGLFQASRSQPYAHAGIAFTLATAHRRGHQPAMQWLERSQHLEPDRPEINFIEAVIYLDSGQADNARLILDHIGGQDPGNYYYCLTELTYWSRRGQTAQVGHWAQQALAGATTRPRRARVLTTLAGFYRAQEQPEKALTLYQQITDLDPDDAWAWHSLSLIYLQAGQLKAAHTCNQQTLNRLDFPAARDLEQTLKKKRGLNRLLPW